MDDIKVNPDKLFRTSYQKNGGMHAVGEVEHIRVIPFSFLIYIYLLAKISGQAVIHKYITTTGTTAQERRFWVVNIRAAM